MELEHTFTVPVPPEQAFTVLQDIERIGPCMPGATIDAVDGKSFTGKVKVKIGPIQVTYAGQAEYASVDADALTAIIKARGKEARGSGTANATVTAAIRAVPDGAEVHVVTDLAITGRPAQFGRGVMEEVGQKLINQFADCLAGTLGEGS
ncbi:MAG TPA: SRPBCC family protein, partial [Euzebya sp.]|nr:SRPBCC family protein [Euzebya sp.]